jgi:hypothetical protein
VRRCASLNDATSFTTSPLLMNAADRAAFARVEQAVRLSRYGGDCYSYCMLAAGHLDLVVETELKSYDIAALIPISPALADRHGKASPLKAAAASSAAIRASKRRSSWEIAARKPHSHGGGRIIAVIGDAGARSVNVFGMFEPLLLLIAAAFLLAGFVKGVIGLGLPTVSMGLLAVTMPPARALAIVIVPAIVTNIWQTFVGPYLRDIIRRLWPLMVGTVIGIWLNAGMLTGPYARYGTIVLGVLLVIYAIVGLSKFSFKVARKDEKWVGGIVGLITGRGFGRDRRAGDPLDAVHAGDRHGKGRAGAGARRVLHGRDAGARLQPHQRRPAERGDRAARRGRDGLRLCRHVHRPGGALAMQPEAFRRWFLIAMIFLGLYLAGSTVAKMHNAL